MIECLCPLTTRPLQVAVDGILAIGEHGDYPINAKGQRLYPRRHFWEQIAGALLDNAL